MEPVDLAYLAGLIDGEGYIGIKRTTHKNRVSPAYHARIQVRMVDEPAIAFLADTLGGSYYYERPSVAKGRPLYCFQASDAKAESILRSLRPYLRVKARNADTVLEFRDLQKGSRDHRTKVLGYRDLKHWAGKTVRVANKGLSDEYIAMCDALYQRCKELNRTGV